ncbi:MAG TPA: HlyD family efflux transporter periplasmic adaptor subunit [Microbacterium sp.]|nr:HlyD family efflux transporter periplasmic adaptor subunit [Microbacterium sp.]
MTDPVKSHPPADSPAAEVSVIDDTMTHRRAVTPAEHVEQRLQVTTPRMWLALVGFVILIVAGLVWGILGRAADQVEGVGVMLPSDGLYELSSPAAGIVRGITAQNGDTVTTGEQVLSLEQADGQIREVRSAIDGSIVALLVKLGSYLDAGTVIASIEPAGSDLQVVVFVGAAAGKQITTGMTAYIAPSTAPAAQYGMMKGTVTEVSSLTVSADQLEVTLGTHSPLIDVLLARGPALEVVVQLERAATPSGFAWTASNGPNFPITSGTPVDASVVIDQSSPLQQILGSE